MCAISWREREKRNIEATSSGEKVEKIPRRFDRSTVKMERKQNACSTNFYESSLFRLISAIFSKHLRLARRLAPRHRRVFEIGHRRIRYSIHDLSATSSL